MWCALHKHMLLVCSVWFYIVPHAQVVIWCTVHMLICVRCIHREYLLLASFWQLTPPYGTSTSAFLHGVYLDLYKSINTSKKVFNSVIGNTC